MIEQRGRISRSMDRKGEKSPERALSGSENYHLEPAGRRIFNDRFIGASLSFGVKQDPYIAIPPTAKAEMQPKGAILLIGDIRKFDEWKF